MRLLTVLISLLVGVAAHAQDPAFDPRSLKGVHAGPPTQVMVLGSIHLSEIKSPITEQMLTPVLDKLSNFRPTVITYEGRSGEQCDMLKRYSPKYP